MTLCDLRKKDVICTQDGRLLGRVSDLEFDTGGQIRALIVPGCCGFFHGDKNPVTIAWHQVACIGDDVILVSQSGCCARTK